MLKIPYRALRTEYEDFHDNEELIDTFDKLQLEPSSPLSYDLLVFVDAEGFTRLWYVSVKVL